MTNRPVPILSVVIPCYRAGADIRRCLDSVLAQAVAFTFEVIVVDSSADGTAETLRRAYPAVHVIELPGRAFPGTARNAGVREARGRVIVFTDADCVVDPGWLAAIRDLHEAQPDVPVIGGGIVNGTPLHPVGTAEFLLEFSEFHSRRPAGKARLLPTCNLSLKRDVFETHGYLDDVITGSDTVYTRRLVERGETLRFTPTFRVRHRNRTGLREFLRHQVDQGAGSAQIRSKHEMPGAVMTRHPALLLPGILYRFGRIGARCVTGGPGLLGMFLVSAPVIAIGLVSYALGFLHEIRRPRGAKPAGRTMNR